MQKTCNFCAEAYNPYASAFVLMDHFDDVTIWTSFHIFFFIKTKNQLRRSIYCAEFSKISEVLQESISNSWKYGDPNLPSFTKKCLPRPKQLWTHRIWPIQWSAVKYFVTWTSHPKCQLFFDAAYHKEILSFSALLHS